MARNFVVGDTCKRPKGWQKVPATKIGVEIEVGFEFEIESVVAAQPDAEPERRPLNLDNRLLLSSFQSCMETGSLQTAPRPSPACVLDADLCLFTRSDRNRIQPRCEPANLNDGAESLRRKS